MCIPVQRTPSNFQRMRISCHGHEGSVKQARNRERQSLHCVLFTIIMFLVPALKSPENARSQENARCRVFVTGKVARWHITLSEYHCACTSPERRRTRLRMLHNDFLPATGLPTCKVTLTTPIFKTSPCVTTTCRGRKPRNSRRR